jgi:hypothetical protein
MGQIATRRRSPLNEPIVLLRSLDHYELGV